MLVFIYLAICIILAVRAENADLIHQVSVNLAPHSDALTAFYYPKLDPKGNGKPKKLPVGEEIMFLAHFSNEGETVLNVTGIVGSLSKASNFQDYVANFPFEGVGFELQPHEEVTISYVFQIPIWIPNDKKYRVAHTILYEEINQIRRYASVVQNSTISLYSNDSATVDAETIGTVLMAILSSIAVLYITWFACCSADQKTISKTVRSRDSTAYNTNNTNGGINSFNSSFNSKPKNKKFK
jgi:hypothetical protein